MGATFQNYYGIDFFTPKTFKVCSVELAILLKVFGSKHTCSVCEIGQRLLLGTQDMEIVNTVSEQVKNRDCGENICKNGNWQWRQSNFCTYMYF